MVDAQFQLNQPITLNQPWSFGSCVCFDVDLHILKQTIVASSPCETFDLETGEILVEPTQQFPTRRVGQLQFVSTLYRCFGNVLWTATWLRPAFWRTRCENKRYDIYWISNDLFLDPGILNPIVLLLCSEGYLL